MPKQAMRTLKLEPELRAQFMSEAERVTGTRELVVSGTPYVIAHRAREHSGSRPSCNTGHQASRARNASTHNLPARAARNRP